ncbi:MAG: Nramp family divalent metal transporter [Candidatus Methanodesulfokora sp.]
MEKKGKNLLPEEVVEKIPTPEEVFKTPKLTLKKKVFALWGSALIALGTSIGSGEFLLGPTIAIKLGLGLFWLIWIGAILQTIYIYSFTRIAIATGETPITTFFRIGVWAAILGALGVFLCFVWGGWAASSATALAGGILGRMPGPADRPLVVAIGISLIILTFVILSLGRRIARTLEIFNWFDLGVIFISFIVLAIILVPPSIWAEAAASFVRVGYIPPKVDLTVFGGWWGYIGFATGVNYILVNYFKDKGYGMGSLTGFISALVGGKKIEVSPFGKIFKFTPENLSVYKRWCKLALEELFIIFCIGAIVGMAIPMILAYSLAYGWKMEYTWNVPLWLSVALNKLWGAPGYWWGVLVAVFVLFKTQMGVADAIVRAFCDTFWKIEGVRKALRNDIRILYYLTLAIILAWASVAMFTSAPVWLIVIAANMANFGAIYGVPFLFYINSKMPKELRMHWALAISNIIFFVICTFIFIVSVANAFGIKLV